MVVNKQTPKEIKRIVIETIPHKDQRYNTCGDWFFKFDTSKGPILLIRVSETGNWKWNMAVALHELAEAILCTANGVSQDAVDKWDLAFQATKEFEEPGEHPQAPYFDEHRCASEIEKILFDTLSPNADLEWSEYEIVLEKLQKEYPNDAVGPTEETDTDR